MIENAISSSSLYSPGSTLNYSQAAMMGLTGSHGSLPDTQQLSFPSHGSIPNIILTGERPGEMESLPCGVRRDGAEVSLPKEARTHRPRLTAGLTGHRLGRRTLDPGPGVRCPRLKGENRMKPVSHLALHLLPSPLNPNMPGMHVTVGWALPAGACPVQLTDTSELAHAASGRPERPEHSAQAPRLAHAQVE